MVGILQFLDFGQASSSKKLMALKRCNDGVEAPRNSLEIPTEASQSYQLINDDIPYSCQVDYHSSKVNACANEAPIKWLINEEISSRSKGRCNKPTLVARLMGMDTLPLETKATIQAKEWKNDKEPSKKPIEVSSTQHASLMSKSIKQRKKSLSTDMVQNSGIMKLQTREHPQQNLLQEFKKDFEAWHASTMWENTKRLQHEHELQNDLDLEKDSTSFIHENLNKQKAPRYKDAKISSSLKKTTEPRYHAKVDPKKREILKSEGWISRQNKSIIRSDIALQDRTMSNSMLLSREGKVPISSSPKRIVILKPSIEISDDAENFWLASPEILGKEINMQGFLEQVKARLEFEMHGTPTRWNENESFFNHCSTDPKQIAQRIAKQIRESVVKDNKTTLMRSATTRSYRSEDQLTGQKSPQFINKYTRRLVSERLKNVLKDDTHVLFPLTANGGVTLSRKEAEMFKPIQCLTKKGKTLSYWEDKIPLDEAKYRPSRHDPCHGVVSDDEVSPRNLVRSFSAPLTGTAFGKLLSEDKHILTAAHIHRKHEASETVSSKGRNSRKDSFSIKNRVSCLRQNLMFKGKFFRKKIQLMDETTTNDFPCTKSNVTTPSVLTNFSFTQENSTEVPPSPVSICSSSPDEYSKPGYPSPLSPLEAAYAEDPSSSQVSGELSSNLCELGQTKLLKTNMSKEEEPTGNDEIPEVDDTKTYLRDILITSGIIERQSFNQLFSGWDALKKPISNWVFDKLEETYNKTEKLDHTANLPCNGDVKVSRRMLFDLLNEALSKVVQTAISGCTSTKWLLNPRRVPLGKDLLDNLSNQIQKLIKPLAGDSYYLENIVAWDLNRTACSDIFHDGIQVMRTELEFSILEELINEFVCDLCSDINSFK